MPASNLQVGAPSTIMPPKDKPRDKRGEWHIDIQPHPSIVGVGTTCTMIYTYYDPKVHNVHVGDSAQKYIYCAFSYLKLGYTMVTTTVQPLLRNSSINLPGNALQRIVDRIESEKQKSLQADNLLESRYWTDITRIDEEWCGFARDTWPNSTAFIQGMPVLRKEVLLPWWTGLDYQINPPTASKQKASEALTDPKKRGERTEVGLKQRISHSVHKDSSGYTLCEIVHKVGGNRVQVGPQIQKFTACTIFYHFETWDAQRTITPARLMMANLGAPQWKNFTGTSLYEIVRYMEILAQKDANLLEGGAAELEYWNNILSYDYRWYEYGQLYDPSTGTGFTTPMPPVIDEPQPGSIAQSYPASAPSRVPILSPPEQSQQPYDQYGQPIQLNPYAGLANQRLPPPGQTQQSYGQYSQPVPLNPYEALVAQRPPGAPGQIQQSHDQYSQPVPLNPYATLVNQRPPPPGQTQQSYGQYGKIAPPKPFVAKDNQRPPSQKSISPTRSTSQQSYGGRAYANIQPRPPAPQNIQQDVAREGGRTYANIQPRPPAPQNIQQDVARESSMTTPVTQGLSILDMGYGGSLGYSTTRPPLDTAGGRPRRIENPGNVDRSYDSLRTGSAPR